MKKTTSRTVILFLASFTLLLQACASTHITRRDLDSIQTIQVARYKTPDFEIKTLAGVIVNTIGAGAIIPTLVAPALDKSTTKRNTIGTIFPDYGELLVKDFIRIAPQAIRGWPKMVEANNPVERSYEYKDGALIVFDIKQVWLTIVGGITVSGYITMRNPNGSQILKRTFWYRSVDFGLKKSGDEYIADNCKLLLEEMPLAAEHTARELIIDPLKEGM